jgi:biopolymer transport protein ExbB
MTTLRLSIVMIGVGVLTATGAAQDTEAAAAATSKSLLDYVNEGGIVSYIIVLLSFVAVALVIRNLIQIRRGVLAPPEVVSRLDTLLKEGDMKGALVVCSDRGNDSSITRIFGAALARCLRSPFGFLEFRSALEESGQKEMERLYRLTDGIGIIAAVGPMLGLLGTVFAMVGAFAAISGLEGASRSQQLAGHMSVALVTTAEGLIVAIPCTVAYALFRRRIDTLFGEVGDITEELSGRVSQEGPAERAGGPPRPARPDPAPRPADGGRRVGVS